MKHIVSFSGGKDSTAMLLRMLEENMKIDEIYWKMTETDCLKYCYKKDLTGMGYMNTLID